MNQIHYEDLKIAEKGLPQNYQSQNRYLRRRIYDYDLDTMAIIDYDNASMLE